MSMCVFLRSRLHRLLSASRPRAQASAVALVATLLLAPQVAADVRVLFTFDASGHRVHSASRSSAQNAELRSHVEPNADTAAAALAGEATLTWLDAAGGTLKIVRTPDPRVGHAPSRSLGGSSAAHGAPLALSEGAWIAFGPDTAVGVVLNLPAVGAPALMAEEWRLSLD